MSLIWTSALVHQESTIMASFNLDYLPIHVQSHGGGCGAELKLQHTNLLGGAVQP